jgi:hypothetical protein
MWPRVRLIVCRPMVRRTKSGLAARRSSRQESPGGLRFLTGRLALALAGRGNPAKPAVQALARAWRVGPWPGALVRVAFQALSATALVLGFALGCGSGGSGLETSRTAGGASGSTIGPTGSGGQGAVSTGGAFDAAAEGIVCIPPPCFVPACSDGYVLAGANTCDCSGPCGCPCGCWTCVPSSPAGTGGVPGGSGGVPLQHRSKSEPCPAERGPAPQFCAGGTCTGQPYPAPSSCSSDSECTAGRNGRCFPWAGLITAGGCSYDECAADSECGAKTPCICRSSTTDAAANVCVVGGNCAVDSDCGPGGYCSPSLDACYSTNREALIEGNNYGGPNPYYCHTAADLCLDDSDCGSPDGGTTATSSCPEFTPCAYNVQNGRWECTQLRCCLP